MYQPLTLFVGLRYSRGRSRTGFVSFITFFSIVGILLGVASLMTVVSVMNGFEGELKKRILAIVPHVLVEEKSGEPLANWQSLQQQAKALPHVQAASPMTTSEALVQSPKNMIGVLMQGIDAQDDSHQFLSQQFVFGNLNSLATTKYSVVIGESLSRKLSVGVGDKIRLMLPNVTRFTPMGRVPMQRMFQVVGVFNMGSQVDDSVVYVSYQSAAKMMRLPSESITQLRLYLDDAFNAELVLPEVQSLSNGYKVTTWQQSQGALFAAVSMEKNMMWLMLSLIIAVAAFNIVSALVMVVIDKQGEIGILKTLGLSRFRVLKVFIVQGMFNGIVGVAFGTALGLALVYNLNDILQLIGLNILGGMRGLPVDFRWSDLVMIVGGAISMTFLASLYPAYAAAKTQPAEVLRNE